MCKTIGIIGGGQLGLMLAEEAALLGARTVCLDPAADAPAFRVANSSIAAAFDDADALEKLCRQSDVITYEFENVPSRLLIELERKYNIPQGFEPLFDAQDRVREKRNALANGLQTPQFAEVNDEASLLAAIEQVGYPCVFKTRTLGYDGHGQAVLRCAEDIAKVKNLIDTPAILEQFVPFDYEASIVMVSDGKDIIHFPIGRNVHRDGILDLCFVPAQMSQTVQNQLIAGSKEFMRRCGYRGILAIEYFVRGNQVLFNEMAPRPHNSGHYTIEGCTTNQFRELARFLLGKPLQSPQLVAPTVMKNILGEDFDVAQCIAKQGLNNVFVHLYGKTECRPKRKMGHITFVGEEAVGTMAQWDFAATTNPQK
ncbi:N5-carboxyaminoimidazole ribonucleotide synthase [Bacteroidia bacterium]|nr:N5-carboxyaminoimidazole ribonucleotide synthase [Bacteroidia bacterium]